MRLRSVPIVLVLVLLAGSAGTVRAEHGGGDIDASCSVDNDPVLEDFVGVERGTSFGVALTYSNASDSDVTFKAIMRENELFGKTHLHRQTLDAVPEGDDGESSARVRRDVPTEDLPEATDRVVIEVTSDETGDTILGRCDFTLTVGTDPDGDGLFTEWETSSGIDVDGDGTGDFLLTGEPYGADPERKNLYVEIDYMEGQRPLPEGVEKVVTAFREAPDGAVGQATMRTSTAQGEGPTRGRQPGA